MADLFKTVCIASLWNKNESILIIWGEAMKTIKKHLRSLLGICLAIFLFCAFYGGLVVRDYTLASPHISSPVKIVLISDLHSQFFGKDQKQLIKKIKQQSPDLILLTGDIIDDTRPIDGTEAFLKGVQDLCPLYYVTGNHDYWYDDINSVKTLIAKYGGTVLSDEFLEIDIGGNRLILAGVEDPVKRYFGDIMYQPKKAMETAFSNLPQDRYKLLLAHRPERIQSYLPYGFDLVVCGHAHGGQIRIPFFSNGLYAVDQGWFPKYVGGLYEHGETTQIVSRGLANKISLPRVFNPPEIAVITLIPE